MSAFGLFSVGCVKRALPRKPIIEQGESPNTFLIFARDPLHPLPLRLCTFAPLRSFLPTALRAVSPPAKAHAAHKESGAYHS